MRIKRMQMQRFGCFNDNEVLFEPGLNVIKGPNEAGKSTLHQALLMGLIDKPKKSPASRRYVAWGGDDWYFLSVEFENDCEGPWILVKDFDRLSVKLSEPSGSSTKNQKQIEGRIGDLLGTSSLNIFRSTVCVSQDSMTDITNGKKEISRSLEEIVTGGDENIYTQKTISKLDNKIKTYKRGVSGYAPKNPGPIAALMKERDALKEQIREDSADRLSQESDEKAQKAAEEKLARIEKSLEAKEAVKEKADKIIELRKEQKKWEGEEESLRETLEKINEAEADRQEATAALESMKPVTELTDDACKEVEGLEQTVKDLKNEKKTTQEIAEELLAKQNEPKVEPAAERAGPDWIAIGAIAAGLVVGGAGIYGFLNQNVPLGVVGLIGGLVLLIYGAYRFNQQRKKRSEPSFSVSEVTDLPTFDEKKLSAAQNALNDRLGELGCENMAELEEKRAKVQEAEQAQRNAVSRIEVLIPGDMSKEKLEEDRGQASRKASSIADQLADPEVQRAGELSATEYEALCQAIEELKERQSTLDEKRLKLAGRLSKEPVSLEQLLLAQERLASVEAELTRAEERLLVYELMSKTMTKARDNTLTRASDEMAPTLGAIFAQLTNGRYESVEVDSNLNIKVRPPEQPRMLVKPDSLSSGTQDQLYLAARLTLMDLLFQETSPPMFLDDPFVKFDRERQQAAIELLETVAEDRQVLLFTCSDFYDDIGHLIELERSGAVAEWRV